MRVSRQAGMSSHTFHSLEAAEGRRSVAGQVKVVETESDALKIQKILDEWTVAGWRFLQAVPIASGGIAMELPGDTTNVMLFFGN